MSDFYSHRPVAIFKGNVILKQYDIMDTSNIFTPVTEAIAEIKKRRNNTELRHAVEQFLNDDIPDHFKGNEPILYLARHVATPSLETLRFVELCKPHSLPIVIGQDIKDKFVSNNSLKRALGKMSILKGTARNSDEIFENFTIIDFDETQGKPFADITTKFGQNIVTFHNYLFNEIYPSGVYVIDESAWVDRNNRGDIREHYKKVLALLIVHGIMFETYIPEDHEFVESILKPIFIETEKRFGCKPLICQLIEPELASQKNWDAYPSIFYSILKSLF